MAAIDMGSRPTPNYGWTAGYTLLDDTNPANGTGEITTFYIYAYTQMSGTKVGSFYGSGSSWTNRDYETIGTVNTGSEQSFSGLHCSVESGDVSGIYYTSGNNYGASGVTSNYGYKSGDQMGTGQQTYTMGTNYVIYAYGEGATLGNTIAPSAIASAEAFGTQKLNLKLAPSGIASAESIGSLSVAFRLLPVALPSAEAFGSPVLVTNLVISPSGIASAGALGTPTLVYHQYLLPTSLASVEVFGTASLSVGCCLLPVALPSLQAFGAATIARFAYHVILDARFVATSPPANRIYVIGRDANGNPVFGTAVDTTELGLVGERLDFQLEHSVPTTANAASVASAMIAKRRLQKNAGFIRIPPNAGAELWDVVSITDAPTAQAGSLYRVTGIRFNYQLARPTPELSHTLLLSAI